MVTSEELLDDALDPGVVAVDVDRDDAGGRAHRQTDVAVAFGVQPKLPFALVRHSIGVNLPRFDPRVLEAGPERDRGLAEDPIFRRFIRENSH